MKDDRRKRIFQSLKEAKDLLDKIIVDLHNGKKLSELKLKVWKSYSLIEYSIGIIRLELKEEGNRGYKPLNSSDQRDAIVFAYDRIEEALTLIKNGNDALDEMRDARDTLKELLISIRPPRKRD